MRYTKDTVLLSDIWKQIKTIFISTIETEPTMSISKIVNPDEELYNIPYMEKISPIFTKTILEKNIPFGEMDILYAV